jgi:hypothetical protein
MAGMTTTFGVAPSDASAFDQLFERWFVPVVSAAFDLLGDTRRAAEVAAGHVLRRMASRRRTWPAGLLRPGDARDRPNDLAPSVGQRAN